MEFPELKSEVPLPFKDLPRDKGTSDVSKWKCRRGGNVPGGLHKTQDPNPN